eukprot:651822-Prorocentrum_minimum.AAC.2
MLIVRPRAISSAVHGLALGYEWCNARSSLLSWASLCCRPPPVRKLMLWGDMIGLAAFAAVGSHIAYNLGVAPLIVAISAYYDTSSDILAF